MMDFHARKPLSFINVKINDAFWVPRMVANRERGLTAVYQQLRNTGRLQAYDLDWQPGSKKPAPHVFWDSDVAKWLEGACYSLMTHPNSSLRVKVEDLVDRILSAQGEDGYLNPHFTVVTPGSRWTNLRDQHELYCAGHLIEAAIAHHRATGQSRFLVGMQGYADLIGQVFGLGEGQRRGYPGHEEIELALVKLYRHTGEERYLNLASYFIEERGRSPHYFEREARSRGEHPVVDWPQAYAYYQAHLPVRQQTEVVGHAVRAMYLYSGMADLALELRDESLFTTLKALWEDLTHHKMYLTGGIGSSRTNEGFTKPYDLPNDHAYAETCAAIGLVFWAHRMLQIELDSRYADVMERALYNGMLSGVSLKGDRFFYVNPLASDGKHHRQAFYACSCCPPNINRLLPTIGEYIYSVGSSEIAVHLYIQSEANIDFQDGTISIIQQTDYPWDGIVCLQIKTERPCAFTLKLRKPGWCRDGRLYLNNALISQAGINASGYLSLTRTWQPGDQIRLQWVMPATRVYAHPDLLADVGKVALMRGPLVYCLEAIDQKVPLHHLRLSTETGFDSQYEPDLLGSVVSLQGTASAVEVNRWGEELYQQKPPQVKPVPFKAIPYYAWDNRDPGEMSVWLPEETKRFSG
jgi:DUF1680 family protein